MNLPSPLRRHLDHGRVWARRHADEISSGWLLVGVVLMLSAAFLAAGREVFLALGVLAAVGGLSGLVDRRAPHRQTLYLRGLVALGILGSAAYILLDWDIVDAPAFILLLSGWLPLRDRKPMNERRNRGDERQRLRLEAIREREERLRRERPGDRIPVPWDDDTAGAN